MANSEFWERFDNYRRVSSKTIRQVCDESGIPYGSLARLRCEGKQPTKFQYVEAMAKSLGVTTRALVYGEEMKSEDSASEEGDLYKDIFDDFMKLSNRQKAIIKATIKTFLDE